MIGWIRNLLFYMKTEKEFRTDVAKDVTAHEARIANLEKHINTIIGLVRDAEREIRLLQSRAHHHDEDPSQKVGRDEMESSQH